MLVNARQARYLQKKRLDPRRAKKLRAQRAAAMRRYRAKILADPKRRDKYLANIARHKETHLAKLAAKRQEPQTS
jgi:hypothetical protein